MDDIIIPSDYVLERLNVSGVREPTRIRLSAVRISDIGVYVILNYMSPKSITEMPLDHFLLWIREFKIVERFIF